MQLERRGAPVELLEGDALVRATGTDRYSCALLDRRGGDLNPLMLCARSGAGSDRGGRSGALPNSRARHAARGRRAGGSMPVEPRSRQSTSCSRPMAIPILCGRGLRRTIVPLFGAIAASCAARGGGTPDAFSPTARCSTRAATSPCITASTRSHRLLIGGRGPMREIDTPAAIPHLTRYAARLWPVLEGIDWTHAWGGRLAMTRDHYPHVHEPAPGVLICLGYNGRGVAMATA